jgi:hypothetical protein
VQSGWNYNPDRPGTDDARKWEWWGDESATAFEDYKLGYYDAKARDFDKLAFLAPHYLIVKSADNKRGETGPPTGVPYFIRNTSRTSTVARHRNDAYGTVPMEANAKNILTVGATFPTKSANPTPADIQMTYFSSWGPTDDGRIKPDLVTDGMEVLSASTRGVSAYASYSGTSVAAPKVAAGMLLIQEYYAKRTGNFMKAASLKALAIHTAVEAGREAGPDYEFGWGLFDLERCIRHIDDPSSRVLEPILAQGATYSLRVVAKGNQPIKVSLAWTDPEATPLAGTVANNRQARLVNDLDLRVTDGLETSLPWTLNPDVPTLPAVPGDNTRDNVEQVLVPVPVAGKTYTILVSHKSVLRNNEQAFSMLISGISQTGCQLTAGLTPSTNVAICKTMGSVRLYASTGTNYRHQWLKDGQIIPNRSSAYLDATQTGRYQVRITQGACSVKSPSVNVTASPVSASLAAAGSTALCNGNSVRLFANSGTNYSYQWQRNSVAIAGANAPFYTATQAGTYDVTVSEGPCTARSSSITVSVLTVQAGAIAANSKVICNGQPIQLSTSTVAGRTYQWLKDGVAQPNAGSSTFFAWQPGNYAVRVSQNGCQSTSPAVQITTQTLKAEVVPSGKVSLCGTATLSANTGSGYQYQWLAGGQPLNGATSPTLRVTTVGTYAISIQQGGCRVTSSPVSVVNNGITARITPQSSLVFSQGGSVVLQSTTGAGWSYQWLRNGAPISGATAVSYTARESGTYSVSIRQGTCTVASPGVMVSVMPRSGRVAVAVPDPSASLLVYPNPTSSVVHLLVAHTFIGDAPQWHIVDLTGRKVLSGYLESSPNGNYSAQVNVLSLQSGTYFVSIPHESTPLIKAFLKQ